MEHWSPHEGPVAPTAVVDRSAPPAPAARRRAFWLDRTLLAVEVVAVAGLAAILAMSLGMLPGGQQDVQAMPTVRAVPTTQATPAWLPTRAPTPEPTAALTPTGRALPAATAAVVSPTPTGTPAPAPTPDSPTGVRFVIPAIGVDAPMVEGDDWETLKHGIGHRIGSAWPGEAGNVVISAHTDIHGAIFRDLGSLRPGDVVLAYTPAGVYHYEVVWSRRVLPTETSVIAPSSEPILTMITCYPPFIATHRIVVMARMLE
jgi:sortase A